MHIEKIKELYKHFSIIPLGRSRKGKFESKAPKWEGWQAHCEKRADLSLLEKHDGNFGICGGFEGIEFIDIDNDVLNAEELLNFIKDNFDLTGYPITNTQSGGYHVYYKCDNPKGNLKLARKQYIPDAKEITEELIQVKNEDGTVKSEKTLFNIVLPGGKPRTLQADKTCNVTLIETRGKGGQVVFYDNFIQGSINNVPHISDEQRDILHAVCQAQNEVAEKDKPSFKTKSNKNTSDPNYKESPGDKYEADPWAIKETYDLLTLNGWTYKNNASWSTWWRPGKNFKQGPSANFQKVGLNKFYNFSPNGDPFGERESSTMFGVRALLKHNGNFSACASELASHYKMEKIPQNNNGSGNADGLDLDEDDLTPIQIKWLILKRIIKEWGLKFRYNQITNVLDYSKDGGKTYIDDLDLVCVNIIAEMEINRKVKSITKNKILEMVSSSVICYVYNPLLEFFKSLPEWDKVDYFKELEKYVILREDEDSEFFFSMFKKHLIRGVKCAGIVKYVNRFAFIFHGPQEIGKSEFIRWLVPNTDLYYEEHIDPNDKDSILALARYLLMNLDELDELNKKDVSKLKSFISKLTIQKRVSYGKHDRNFNRISTIFGSTNKDDILADDQNTRWLIFKVLNFKWKGYLKNINPLQLWAQAVYELKADTDSGELTKEEKQKRDLRNDSDFLQISQERELLLQFFEAGNTPMTSTDVKYLIETKMNPLKVNDFGLRRELRRLYGEPSAPTREDTVRGDKNKQGRYYYLKTDIYEHTLNAFTDEKTKESADEALSENVKAVTEYVRDDMPF